MNKKWFSILFVIMVMFSATACNSDTAAPVSATDTDTAVVEDAAADTEEGAAEDAVANDPVRLPNEQVTDWQVALQYLQEGNERYLSGRGVTRDTYESDRAILGEGQWPFAVVLTCSDSRVPPEIFFDQRKGDIFVIRNAGNIADSTALGSLEFAVEHLGAPLIVVVGHSECGAVIGSLSGGQDFSENLQGILNSIATGIEGTDNAVDAINANIERYVNVVNENSVVQRNNANVIGAHFDIVTGEVTFVDI